MVKIFIGNLPQQAEAEELKALFSEYGTVTECAIIKNFGFVHMDDRKSATKAIRSLHLHKLHGTPINVEASRGKNQGPVKLHVANVEKGNDEELKALFEEYGSVAECAIIKNFAFVHMNNYDEAMDALRGLDNCDFQGKRIHVQISKSRPRGEEEDYGPPEGDYWPPRFRGEQEEPPAYRRGPNPYPPGPSLLPPPPRRPMYPEQAPPMYEREHERGRNVVDYYEKYRARPYAASAYEERRPGGIPPPPPPPAAILRERMAGNGVDPYERRPLPPPPAPFYARDRSPIRRGPPPPPAATGNGFSYERARLSPIAMSRPPMYSAPRARDPYDRPVPPPPPPSARYEY